MPAAQEVTLPFRTAQGADAANSHLPNDEKGTAETAPKTPTTSWTPNFARRQSWSAQDRRHELQMAAVEGVRTGPGFTERSP
ncbi:hypothetical protein NLG97_g3103 [Lecanicillium saksenae]|uniref:Uncharacterized protein n=1 Tax=Lecanicillium saksenae TaxID=468837 RepID=A0ACC1R0X7_9HYPO|nr:hypothetical protein NLG97_g3103 [Lecanicillium saksenae]